MNFMNKQSLIHLLKEGLNTRRISQDDYNHALDLYALIYEEKTEDESSDKHEELCSIINTATASGVMNPQLTSDQAAVIEAEIKAAEEYISLHPILSVSPSDLERKHISIADHLSQPCWTPREVELWKEYYDV